MSHGKKIKTVPINLLQNILYNLLFTSHPGDRRIFMLVYIIFYILKLIYSRNNTSNNWEEFKKISRVMSPIIRIRLICRKQSFCMLAKMVAVQRRPTCLQIFSPHTFSPTTDTYLKYVCKATSHKIFVEWYPQKWLIHSCLKTNEK